MPVREVANEQGAVLLTSSVEGGGREKLGEGVVRRGRVREVANKKRAASSVEV